MTNPIVARPIHLGQATVMVVIISAIGSVFAVLREALVAARLGANQEMDAYFFVYTFIVSMPFFTMDAIKKSLTPVYIHYENEDKYQMVSSIINMYALLYVGITLVTVLIAQFATFSVLTGFDANSRQLVSRMIWILSPTILFLGLWGILRVLLEADGLFFASAVSDAFMAVFVIGSVLLTNRSLGVYSLPLGVLLSSIFQFVWVGYWLWRQGFKYSLVLNFNHPELKRSISLFWPPLLAAFLGYAIPTIDRSMASHLPEGTISSLSYADKIVMTLQGIFIVPMTRVLLPSLAQKIKNTDLSQFRESVTRVLGIIIYMLMPLSIALVSIRLPLVQLFYQRGKFDAFAATNTANFFGWLILGLTPMACAVTLETIFSALEDTKTGSYIGVGSKFFSKIIFNVILIYTFGTIGIAMASPLMYIVSGCLLFVILWKRLKDFEGKRLIQTLISTMIASILAILPASFIADRLELPALLTLAMVSFVGTSLFLIFSNFLKIPEFAFGLKFLKTVTRQLVERYVAS